MDMRNREATKRYRPSSKLKFKTISLTLEGTVISSLEDTLANREDGNGNMSHLIEEIVTSEVKSFREEVPARRAYATCPVKKTFTFTPEFVKMIKAFPNMSLAVEKILSKYYDIPKK